MFLHALLPLFEAAMIEWINTSGSYEFTTNMENVIVGIIGMGDMGKMYARRISDAGWR